MFDTILGYFNVTVASCFATFVFTMIFHQKIIDWFKGVPAEVRQSIANVEATVLAHIKANNANVVNAALVAIGNAQAQSAQVQTPPKA